MTTEDQGKRKYQEVWELLVKKTNENPEATVRVQVRTLELMKRVRKALWKEKSLDEDNREKWRLNCAMDLKAGILEFSLTEILDAGDV